MGARPAVNLRSVFLCCKHGIPHLLDNDGPLRGSVINTASFVAVMGAATSQISYTASKGGVLALSRELGVEFARRGVRVNALCPGPVDTPLLRELFAKDPEQGRAPARARADGPLRPRRGDRPGRAVPGQRRLELRDRVDVPHRRRPQRRVHDAARLGGPAPAVGGSLSAMEPDRARQLLARERERVEQALVGVRHVRPSGTAGDPEPGERDSEDLYQDEYDQGQADDLAEQLAAVERAEARLAAGTYGISIDSGEPIPDARLEALPTAERTVSEQELLGR